MNFRRRDSCNICSRPRKDSPPLANVQDDRAHSRVHSSTKPPPRPRIESRYTAHDPDFETPRNRGRARSRERDQDSGRRHRVRNRSRSRDVSRSSKRRRQRSHERSSTDSSRGQQPGEKYSVKAERRESYACLWCKSLFQTWADCTKVSTTCYCLHFSHHRRHLLLSISVVNAWSPLCVCSSKRSG